MADNDQSSQRSEPLQADSRQLQAALIARDITVATLYSGKVLNGEMVSKFFSTVYDTALQKLNEG